ncbi:MAG TPA: Maf family protein [Micromonosporaceae bacterium]
MKHAPRLVLASSSPARRTLLRAAGIDPEVIVSGVDESVVDSADPEVLSLTLARLKAEAVAARLRDQGSTEPTLVLGCDSVLAFDGYLFGKPTTAAEAVGRWHAMRGRSGVLYTGHCLVDLSTGKRAEAASGTTVHFADLDDHEIEAYVATGEPLRVAGAFTIDGLGSPFVERIEGDHGTVVGLSMPVLRRLLAEFGVSVADLWQGSPDSASTAATTVGT